MTTETPAPSVAPASPDPIALAPLHRRLFALLIDYLLAVALLNLGNQLLLGEHWDLRTVPEDSGLGYLYRGVALLLIFLAKDGLGGRSPGKWLVGIAIRDAEDPSAVPSLARLARRNFALLLLPVEGWLVFRDPYCRRLGDLWAGTVVVAPQGGTPLGRRLLGLGSLLLAILLSAFLIGPWNLHRTAAWQTGISALERDPDLAARTMAGFEMEESPLFDLRLSPAGSTATLEFNATRGREKITGRVKLWLDPGAKSWQVEGVTLDEPEERDSKADRPLIEDAPPEKN